LLDSLLQEIKRSENEKVSAQNFAKKSTFHPTV